MSNSRSVVKNNYVEINGEKFSAYEVYIEMAELLALHPFLVLNENDIKAWKNTDLEQHKKPFVFKQTEEEYMQSIDPSPSEAEIIKAEILFSKLREKYEEGPKRKQDNLGEKSGKKAKDILPYEEYYVLLQKAVQREADEKMMAGLSLSAKPSLGFDSEVFSESNKEDQNQGIGLHLEAINQKRKLIQEAVIPVKKYLAKYEPKGAANRATILDWKFGAMEGESFGTVEGIEKRKRRTWRLKEKTKNLMVKILREHQRDEEETEKRFKELMGEKHTKSIVERVTKKNKWAEIERKKIQKEAQSEKEKGSKKEEELTEGKGETAISIENQKEMTKGGEGGEEMEETLFLTEANQPKNQKKPEMSPVSQPINKGNSSIVIEEADSSPFNETQAEIDEFQRGRSFFVNKFKEFNKTYQRKPQAKSESRQKPNSTIKTCSTRNPASAFGPRSMIPFQGKRPKSLLRPQTTGGIKDNPQILHMKPENNSIPSHSNDNGKERAKMGSSGALPKKGEVQPQPKSKERGAQLWIAPDQRCQTPKKPIKRNILSARSQSPSTTTKNWGDRENPECFCSAQATKNKKENQKANEIVKRLDMLLEEKGTNEAQKASKKITRAFDDLGIHVQALKMNQWDLPKKDTVSKIRRQIKESRSQMEQKMEKMRKDATLTEVFISKNSNHRWRNDIAKKAVTTKMKLFKDLEKIIDEHEFLG